MEEQLDTLVFGDEGEYQGMKIRRPRMALAQQSDVDGFCDVLKEVGAVYYRHLMQFREVEKLRLLRVDTKKNDAVPPDRLGERWKWGDGVEE